MSTPETKFGQSSPLYALGEMAPPLQEAPYDPYEVFFPFSNDEAAPHFKNALSRTARADYQGATNRTAVVVGESSLAALLGAGYIPEDTIVMIDDSSDMCSYMQSYIEGVQQTSHPSDWTEHMHFNDDAFMQTKAGANFFMKWLSQIQEWEDTSEVSHAFLSPNRYLMARKAMTSKAIIPWCVDITSRDGMDELGAALVEHDANVTMLNLTNVVQFARKYKGRKGVPQLDSLPLTEHAPILTTSLYGIDHPSKMLVLDGLAISRKMVYSAGIFYGLEDFYRHKGHLGKERHPEYLSAELHDASDARVAAGGLFRQMADRFKSK